MPRSTGMGIKTGLVIKEVEKVDEEELVVVGKRHVQQKRGRYFNSF